MNGYSDEEILRRIQAAQASPQGPAAVQAAAAEPRMGSQAAPGIIDPNRPLAQQQKAFEDYWFGTSGAGEKQRKMKEQQRLAQIMRGLGDNRRMDWASQAARGIGGITSAYQEMKGRESSEALERQLAEERSRYLRAREPQQEAPRSDWWDEEDMGGGWGGEY